MLGILATNLSFSAPFIDSTAPEQLALKRREMIAEYMSAEFRLSL